MAKRGLIGLLVMVCLAPSCSSRHVNFAQNTCRTLSTFLTTDSGHPYFYLSEIALEGHEDTGRLGADALALSSATATEYQTDLVKLENDCDNAGYRFNWGNSGTP